MKVEKEIDETVRVIGILASSSSGNELCRRFATDEFFGIGTLGVQLYALTNVGGWQLLGSYGQDPFSQDNLSQLDENILTEAARTKSISVGNAKFGDQEADVVACVYLRGDVPVGAILRSSTPGNYQFSPNNGTLKAIQDCGGLFLDAIGYKTVASGNNAKQASPEDLTERQQAILIDMALGKTNFAIANRIILSESTIKQESVKIFRALGVSTRQQAVMKAKALGLLPEGIEMGI